MNLYIDIDGVLLTKKQTLPPYAFEFIDFVIQHFDCYWLTTHCKGDPSTALRYLADFYPADYIQKLSKLKPTCWDTLKTEAIDFAQPFYWLDDYAFQSEKSVLKAYQVLPALIEVDLSTPHELKRIINELREIV